MLNIDVTEEIVNSTIENIDSDGKPKEGVFSCRIDFKNKPKI